MATRFLCRAVVLAIALGVVVSDDNVTNTTITPAATNTTITGAPNTTAAPATTTAAPASTATPITQSPASTTAVPPTTTAVPATPVPLQSGSLKAYVFLDSTMMSTNLSVFSSAIDSYLSSLTIDAVSLFSVRPVLVDTQGNMLSALAQLQNIITGNGTFPDVIFVGCRADVSIAIGSALKVSSLTARIPLISIHTANTQMCDPSMNPSAICLVPRDYLNVRAAVQIVATSLGWASAAVVLSNDAYGQGVAQVLATEILNSPSAPTVVWQQYMPTASDNATDEAVIRNIVKYNPVGVLAFVKDSELMRLKAAAIRIGVTNIFFLGSRESLNIVGLMTGSKENLNIVPLWGALVVPMYKSSSQWITDGVAAAKALDEIGAFLLSFLLDGVQLIMNARQCNIARIRAATVVGGFTGTIVMDSTSFQRGSVIYKMISNTYDVTRQLVTWTMATASSVPVIDVATQNINLIVAPSPLLAVTVCMAAPSSCADVSNVNALLYSLLYANANRVSNTSVSYIPVPVYTGSSGVEGLTNLIPIARSCTILTGPGRSKVATALTPVVNQYKIAQIDYSSASGIFSNLLSYPYFSRTIPVETYQFAALGEAASYFGWERVILISTTDSFGTLSMAAAQDAMDSKTILVESTYSLSDTSNASIAAVFAQIKQIAISRVIFFLIPLQDADAANFYQLVNQMGMNDPATKYIFFLSNDLCLFGQSNATARFQMMNSICMTPFVDPTAFANLQNQYNASGLQSSLMQTLYAGGFTGVYDCNISSLSTYNAFALDTGSAIIDVVARAQAQGVSLTNSAGLVPLIRSTSLTTLTGTWKIDGSGDRDYSAYSLNIQTPTGVVTFAKWDTSSYPNFVVDNSAVIGWFDNTTTPSVPSSTYRSIGFITQSTVTTNPGTIVLSVLGFAGTVAVFFFCYRHYKMQRLIELSLERGVYSPEKDGREMA